MDDASLEIDVSDSEDYGREVSEVGEQESDAEETFGLGPFRGHDVVDTYRWKEALTTMISWTRFDDQMFRWT
ncbi:unnamed protein product [Arabis nemorensis]|uniref:Uncharacterized protein n=1 Tax=Arabis nemorensis TaxID=586526 RepID=A0A565CA10_9BRAS|nr:unnamed protein product [Arabis nemorensis]